MFFSEILENKNYTVYALSKKSGVAKTTIFDIYNGKSNIFDCSAGVLLKISKALSISIEDLLNLQYGDYNQIYEEDLPDFLKRDINLIKKSKRKNDGFLDCYLDETNSSINVCEIENLISKEQADYLRKKYLERR